MLTIVVFFNSVVPIACDPNPCQNGGTCTVIVKGYECTCAAGFMGSHCEGKGLQKQQAVKSGQKKVFIPFLFFQFGVSANQILAKMADLVMMLGLGSSALVPLGLKGSRVKVNRF